MLNERQKKIIKILKDNKNWMTGKELSEFLNVSDRTIRSDIEYINRYNNALIESNVKNGYHLNFEANLNTYIGNITPQTSFERCFYIVHELLFKKNGLNLIYLADKLFVSSSSIENDLKQIKIILKPYFSLKLVRRKNYIYLEGNEEDKRKLYVNLLLKKIEGNLLNLDFLAAQFPNFDLLDVKKWLESIFQKHCYSVREIEFLVIIIYTGVAIERILCHDYIKINKEQENKENIADSTEFAIAEEFFKKASEELNIELLEDEIDYLTLILLKKTGNGSNGTTFLLNSGYTVNQLVNDILQDIYIQFDVDLRHDEDLKDGLANHIQLLLERKKKNIDVSNFYLDELKYKYPLFFEMAVLAGKLIKDKLNVEIDENDISFIAQHIGGAVERMDSKNKYKVIMIDPNNQALSSLCIKKLQSMFHERMIIVGCMNYFEKKKVIDMKPDLILTTLPLVHNLNILTVQISIFVNSEDETKIYQALNLLDQNKLKEEFATSIKTMMEPRFFYMDLDLDTPKEVLNFMSDELYKAGLVDENFKESVLKREELSPTSFIYSFAVPHPLNAMSKESKIPIAFLKKPIQWGEFQVKLVLLLAIEDEKQKTLRIFFDWLSSMVNDSKKLCSLMQVKSYDEFINHIIE